MASVTVSLGPQLDRALTEIAARAQRPKEDIVGEAIAAFIEAEEAAVAAIRQGQADAQSGLVTAHQLAIQRLRKAATGG
jgi:predicted transcriptional regulator